VLEADLAAPANRARPMASAVSRGTRSGMKAAKGSGRAVTRGAYRSEDRAARAADLREGGKPLKSRDRPLNSELIDNQIC